MTISSYLSTVTMPSREKPYPTMPHFLHNRFPRISCAVWEQRILAGKVLNDSGDAITSKTEYIPNKRIFYYREVEKEPIIPFREQILFQNDHLLVACKPHFLPVIPGGPYVSECLLNRLRKTTGNDDLVPLHRIDRETAGVVMFSANRATRGLYSQMFMNGLVEKDYHAVAGYSGGLIHREWKIENRIEKGEPWFRVKIVPGLPNSTSVIKLVETKGNMARFLLHPLTGKTHQLRLHMSGLGFGILNDRYYPELEPERADDFDKPLQLLAESVRFKDPLSGDNCEFTSQRKLLW